MSDLNAVPLTGSCPCCGWRPTPDVPRPRGVPDDAIRIGLPPGGASGVYFLTGRPHPKLEHEVRYVGQSTSLLARLTYHSRYRTIGDAWAIVMEHMPAGSSGMNLDSLERYWIKRLCPRENVAHKPGKDQNLPVLSASEPT